MKEFSAALALAAALAVLPAPAVQSPYDAGVRRALKRGYSHSQAVCYGGVFARYASLNPRGHYGVQGGRGFRSPFYQEAWNSCQVYW